MTASARRFLPRAALAAAALAGLALAVAAPAQAPVAGSQPALPPPPAALIAPGKAPDLELLYTGDVIGYLDPCG